MNAGIFFVRLAFATLSLWLACAVVAGAQPSPSPSPTPTPTAAPSVPAPPPSGAPGPSPVPASGPAFYNMVEDIDSPYDIDRNATAYYYFQKNTNGSAKAKYELRYGRDLWNDNAILRIRIPYWTQYPNSGNPFSGLGNIEIGYAYNVSSKPFDHSLEFRIAFPTTTNHVVSNDTQIKGFYTTKWKWPGGAAIYVNEYDQSIIVPPGASWTSYYEGKFDIPNYKITPGITVAAIYNFRVLFDTNGTYKPAVGGTIFGNFNDVAVSLTDTWGYGPNALWKYKPEVNVTAKF
ncbi:MAG TPA: hypothetical protein VFF60_10855 [Candidatus Binatus sp.]|nr:hypothetical protein [Candidatus Binatus sp.]